MLREFGLKRQSGATKAFGVERDANGLVHFSCSCDAGSKLPIHVVDEDIYDELPSLVVATVTNSHGFRGNLARVDFSVFMRMVATNILKWP